ncbi:MAG: four helix bundle protein [Patescibacteria group bacterium]
MNFFKKVEEIKVWQESMILVEVIYQQTNNKYLFRNDYGLIQQMQRAAVSIPSNIAEGFERGTKKEFVRFLYISKGSCSELKTQLYLANKLLYIKTNDFVIIKDKCEKISSMIACLIKVLRKNI